MWLYRLLVLFLLCVSLPAMAQSPEQAIQEQSLMLECMQEAHKSLLSQADVDVFVKVYRASKSLKESNLERWKEIEATPMVQKEKIINKLYKHKKGERFLVSAWRVQMAARASTPKGVAEAKKEYELLKAQESELEKQMEKIPQQQAEFLEIQLDASLEMMRIITEYPAENLKVYTSNQKIINEAMAFFELDSL